MKIVQSYWSKPFRKNISIGMEVGGWCNSIFFYMSWALSCLSLRRFYNDVELYTDRLGKELLIDELKLPYTKVHIVLDELDRYDESFWAIGKLYTYSLQETPFIHVDGDVYIWKPFPQKLLKAELLAQHLEDSYPFNIKIIKDTIENLSFLPDVITLSKNRTKEVNAGIIGGCNWEFFQSYTKEAFNFIEKNIECISNLKYKNMFNTIFEQFLFYSMSEYYNKEVTYAFENIDERFKPFGEFESLPQNYYIHALAFYKKIFYIGEAIAYHLYKLSPKHYDIIINKMSYDKCCSSFL